LNVHHLIVLLAAISYFNLGFVHAYEYFNSGGQHPTEQHPPETGKMNNVNLKPEMNMEKPFYNTDAAAGQLKPATIIQAESTTEVHYLVFNI
jgi:hypothetical protein